MSRPESVASNAGLMAWEHRRTWSNTWTRTDTVRWLDERSAALAAHYSRDHGISFSRAPRQMGQWIARKLPANFAVMHERMVNAKDRRDALTLEEVLP